MAIRGNDAKNIKLGIFISYFSLAVSLMGYFVVTKKVLYYIGDYNYGLYSFVLSIVNWATIVSNALNASYIRFAVIEAERNGDVGRINSIYVKLLGIISVAILAIGFSVFGLLYFWKVPLFEYSWDDSRTLYCLFATSLINVAFSILTSVYSLFVNYKKEFVFSRLLSLGVTILGFAAHWALAYYTKSVMAIAVYSIVATLINAIGNLIYSRKCLGYHYKEAKLRDNRILLKQIAAFSGIILFNTLVDQINASVDQMILGAMGAPESVTIYKLGQSLSTYLTTMSLAVSSSYVPTINELVAKGKDDEINALYLKVSRMQTIVLCTVAFGFLSCGYDFIQLWLGQKRIEAFYVGVTLMLLNLCPLTINASIEVQRARNKHLFRALVYFFVALGNVALSALFLFLFPKDKAIYACLLGTVIAVTISHWIVMNIYNAKAMHLPVLRQMGTLGLFMALGAACWGITYAFFLIPALSGMESHFYRFLIKGSLFVAFYLPCLVLLNWKSLKPRLISIISRLRKRDSDNEI